MTKPRLYVLAGVILLICAALACSYTPPGRPAGGSATQEQGTPAALPTRVVVVTNTATPTATSTPTPTATATPTPRPAVRLAEAARAMFDGDYIAAKEQYDAVLGSPASADEIRAAQFGAAKARLRAGDPAAQDALQAFIAGSSGDSRQAEAWFLLGQARMSAGAYADAVEAYRQYQKLSGDLIAPHVDERIGDALRADKQSQAAAQAYRAALAAAPLPNMALDLREKLAGALLDANDTSGALAQYDAILAGARITSYRARIQTLAAQALDAAGQKNSAQQRRLLIVGEYAAAAASQLACPDAGYAYDALVALVGDNAPVDEFERGLVDYCANQYDPALAAFTRSIQAGSRVAESRYFAGLAFRAQGDTSNALRQFNLIIQNLPNTSVWGLAWLEKAQTLSLAGDVASAVATYRELAAKYPDSSQAPEALWRAAQLLDRAQDAGAAQAYRALQQTFPASSHAGEALYRAGLAAHTAGDDQAALAALQALSNAYPVSDWSAAGLMWQGKLALAQKETISATEFFSQAATFSPGAFYSVRAGEWLRGESVPLRPISSTLTFDEAAERAAAETWLAARLGISDTAQLRGLRADLAADPALQRGLELNKLDLQSEAIDEFDAVRLAHQDDAVALYQLAILFRDAGIYRLSIRAAAGVIRLAGSSVADAPPFLARLVYPAYYADLVAPEAQARRLDPLLVFALIRQESLFESLAYSTAAAHGLMQVIPATGQEIATALAWPDYARADLYKPYISIKFGVYYLARQRDTFDGDLYAALAAYNAGPATSARWKAISGSDPDVFYETIPTSWQTHDYIRLISEYYEVYKKLYAAK